MAPIAGAAMTNRRGGQDQHDVAEDRGVEPGLALAQAEAVLAELKFSSAGHLSPAARISRGMPGDSRPISSLQNSGTDLFLT
jgi:hypothetical protein